MGKTAGIDGEKKSKSQKGRNTKCKHDKNSLECLHFELLNLKNIYIFFNHLSDQHKRLMSLARAEGYSSSAVPCFAWVQANVF